MEWRISSANAYQCRRQIFDASAFVTRATRSRAQASAVRSPGATWTAQRHVVGLTPPSPDFMLIGAPIRLNKMIHYRITTGLCMLIPRWYAQIRDSLQGLAKVADRGKVLENKRFPGFSASPHWILLTARS